MAMAMARNDVEYALRQAVRANEEDSPWWTFWVRLANGFTFEGIRTLQAWRQEPEVKQFLSRLPADGKKALKTVSGVEQRMGRDVLKEVRQHTFHYPRPEPRYNPDSSDRLREILEAEADALVEIDQLTDGSIRFTFADNIALGLALGKHYHPADPRFMGQAKEAVDGAIAFANLAMDVLIAYFKHRDIRIAPPEG
jgi:hypothetical protein